MENSTSVFNGIQYSVYKMEVERVCNIELNTICTVRDSTRCVEWIQHEVLNSTRRGEWKLNTDCIKWKVLLHCRPTVYTFAAFYTFTFLHFPLFGEWKG